MAAKETAAGPPPPGQISSHSATTLLLACILKDSEKEMQKLNGWLRPRRSVPPGLKVPGT